jgi:putative SOS response-associated peptidase YedK
MCNLYQMTPKDDLERHFRARLRGEDYRAVAVGPFGWGALLRPGPMGLAADGLECLGGQWGMIAPSSRTRRPQSRTVLTNNARAETLAEKWTYREAWARGRRCLIPAAWYQEPNWETGRNIWWQLRRADGAPWALAGLWSEWTDPQTGELVPSYTLITCNCDGHPLLGRLHKPDPNLPQDAQDKRSVVALEPADWATWLEGSQAQARALIRPPALEVIDASVTRQTDQLLAQRLQAW